MVKYRIEKPKFNDGAESRRGFVARGCQVSQSAARKMLMDWAWKALSSEKQKLWRQAAEAALSAMAIGGARLEGFVFIANDERALGPFGALGRACGRKASGAPGFAGLSIGDGLRARLRISTWMGGHCKPKWGNQGSPESSGFHSKACRWPAAKRRRWRRWAWSKTGKCRKPRGLLLGKRLAH